MEAIVLAGGFGTRLRGTIGDIPKPMAPVSGRPFLSYLLRSLAQSGFTHVILSVGHLHQIILDHFGARFESLELEYAIEQEPLGTGGAIRASLGMARNSGCFVLNGDTFVNVDFQAMHRQHAERQARMSMAVIHTDDVGRFGAVEITEETVTGFSEKDASDGGFINAGAYFVNGDVFDEYDLPERFSFETDVLKRHLPSLRPHAYRAEGPFLDIGVPEDYRRAAAFLTSLQR